MRVNYSRNVFINCPFDKQYEHIFQAIIFAVMDCGYKARCALEIEDSSETRIDKIYRIIRECQYGIHDISRIEPDNETGFPRFNMPFELGLFLGAKRYGEEKQKSKMCLILDRSRFRYQSFFSDIAGQDIQSHENTIKGVIKVVRNWLQIISPDDTIPNWFRIEERYVLFRKELPAMLGNLSPEMEEIIFVDYRNILQEWLKCNP